VVLAAGVRSGQADESYALLRLRLAPAKAPSLEGACLLPGCPVTASSAAGSTTDTHFPLSQHLHYQGSLPLTSAFLGCSSMHTKRDVSEDRVRVFVCLCVCVFVCVCVCVCVCLC
jgi:hypothetical protein